MNLVLEDITEQQRKLLSDLVVVEVATMIKSSSHFKEPEKFMMLTDLNFKLKGIKGHAQIVI